MLAKKGVFIWPKVGFPPKTLLGHNLEALDPIRTENHCYITFEHDSSRVRIWSHQQSSINSAVQRIRSTLYEIISRSMEQIRIYMIEPMEPSSVRREVELVTYERFMGTEDSEEKKVVPKVVPCMTGPAPTAEECGSWISLKPSIVASNERCVKRTVSTVLARMRYYRGHIRMRVLFGVMSLRAYKKPGESNHNLEEFFSMIRNPQTIGEVVRECVSPRSMLLANTNRNLSALSFDQDDEKGRLLSSCCTATDVLDPLDAVTQSLTDVTPEFSASFDLATADRSSSMRLELSFVNSDTGNFEISSARWLKRDSKSVSSDFNGDVRKEKVPLSLITMDLHKYAHAM